MNLHSALVVLHRHGFADLHGERLHDSASIFVEAVEASMEGLSQLDLKAALSYAFDDTRDDMQLRSVAFLGVLLGYLKKEAEEIRLATPEDWQRSASSVLEEQERKAIACTYCQRSDYMRGTVWTCPQCGENYVRNGEKSSWRKSHIKVPALKDSTPTTAQGSAAATPAPSDPTGSPAHPASH